MANEMKQQLSPARDASQNEPVERGAEDIPNSIQQKAAEALALLGFEALYQDVFEDGAASGYKSVSSNANSGASRTSGDLLIGNDTSVSTLAASSRGSVARFHQQRIDKYNDRTRKVEIRMVPDDLVGKRITPKRKGAFLTTDKSAHDSKRLMRPSKRGTMGMKMKEWLQSRRAGLTNSKGKVELKKKINANARSMEERPLVEKKRRLTIVRHHEKMYHDSVST